MQQNFSHPHQSPEILPNPHRQPSRGNLSTFATIGRRMRNFLSLDSIPIEEPEPAEAPFDFESLKNPALVRDYGHFVINKNELIPNPNRPDRPCEDRSFADLDLNVFGVFDGAGGGGKDPALAAQIAAETSLEKAHKHLPKTALEMAKVLTEVNSAVHRNPQAGITTASLGRVIKTDKGEKKLIWANVGDSRIYIVRKNRLAQITTDEGFGNIITNCVGQADQNFSVNHYGTVSLQTGDRLLFCSDGITGDFEKDFIPNDELASLISSGTSSSAAKKLCQRATKIDDRTAEIVEIA